MKTKENVREEASLSRRSLLMNSAKLTAGAVALYGAGAGAGVLPAEAEAMPEVTEEIAGHWTTF
jgi:hypothetical protein